MDIASSLSNTGDLLKELEPEVDLNELIPSYVFDIVESDWKSPFVIEYQLQIINDQELEQKIHNTFVHDKVVFDTFNSALRYIEEIQYYPCPWEEQTRNISCEKYSKHKLVKLLEKGKS